jgi:hypothetical protein
VGRTLHRSVIWQLGSPQSPPQTQDGADQVALLPPLPQILLRLQGASMGKIASIGPGGPWRALKNTCWGRGDKKTLKGP